MATSPVVVVGAGAAGLAVAAALRRRAVPFVVLERGDAVGASWGSRYDSLHLHTARWLSGLPGAPIPKRYGQWVSRDDLISYYAAYADRFDVRPELGVRVTRVDRDGADRQGSGWRVETSAGPRDASAVVLATGYCCEPFLPDWPGLDAFTSPVVHSSEYREPSAYLGRRVLVVGAGNSASEIAVELAGAGAEVLLAVRTPPNIFRRDTLGVPSQLVALGLKHAPDPVLNQVGRVLRRVTVPDLAEHGLPAPGGEGFTQFLRTRTVPILDHGFVAAVRAGKVTVVAAVQAFDEGSVLLADGTSVAVDAVVAATGFRPGLEPVVGHLGVLDDHGEPLAHGAESLPQAPGLYFAGISITLAGQLREIGRDAKAIGDALAPIAVRAQAAAGS